MSKVNAMIIGAGRAGTTSLYALLEQHPDVCFSSIKEVHYFSIPDLYERGEDYYHSFYAGCREGQLRLAADTYLMIAHEAIERIHSYNPDMRILVMLRDPVARAWSSYNYSVNYGHHEAYASFLDSMEKEKDIASETDIVKRNNEGHFYASLYHHHLQKWMEVFSREQICLLSTKDMKDDPEVFRKQLFSFLGLEDMELEIPRANPAAVPRNKGLEQFLLNREGGLRKLIRKLTPAFIKRALMGSGVVDRLHDMNRVEQNAEGLDESIRDKAVLYFQEDLSDLERDYGVVLP